MWFDFRVTAGCWSETDVCHLLFIYFFMRQRYLSCDLSSSCNTAKHLLFETQMSGARLPPQTQSACEIANGAWCWSALLCGAADQCSSLVKSSFQTSFKKWFHKVFNLSLNELREVMATLTAWAATSKLNPTTAWLTNSSLDRRVSEFLTPSWVCLEKYVSVWASTVTLSCISALSPERD